MKPRDLTAKHGRVAALQAATWLARVRAVWAGSAVWGTARWWMPGLLGMALLVSGAAVPLLDALRAEREAEAQTLRQRLLARSTAPAQSDRVQDAAGFVQRFPAAAAQGPRLAALLAGAGRQGLLVQRAELREAAVPGLPGLVQQRVSLPVSGPPRAVWAWAGEALEQDPAMALLRLRIERDRGRRLGDKAGADSAGSVRADLEFALYARSSEPGARVAAR